MPFVGQNVAAVRATTEATHILVEMRCRRSSPSSARCSADKIRFEGGGFDLEPFRQALAALPGVDAASRRPNEDHRHRPRHSLPVVDDTVRQCIMVIDEAAPLRHTAIECCRPR